jgi:hypothetical protein
MTLATPLRPKALAVLREGRLTMLRVECRNTAHEVDEVIARVQSSREGGPAYAVDLSFGQWTCTCRRDEPCAHIAAVQLVTGHHKAAA